MSRALVPFLMGILTSTLCSNLALAAEDKTRAQCGEIAHRIACHAVSDCSGKKRESDATFEKRDQLTLMVMHLCEHGPKEFSEYWWIDVSGAYRPYYSDKNGKKSKFPSQ